MELSAISENYKDFLHLTTPLAALAEAKKAQADLASRYYVMAQNRLAQAFVEHSELAVQWLCLSGLSRESAYPEVSSVGGLWWNSPIGQVMTMHSDFNHNRNSTPFVKF
ncbi:hypothetical protein L873DRAFT_1845577 [Choiromyces venosus 120613-1]|uniref:Uncharacterized protein n=1 Tax=Choiromyces venosus 120613-1 TaxID=1336337 RepID=A0A3N4JCR5_9PEZI|nr:hypothetical protein L873DRAFT_1845577 [Choiromyces venosus 120613-1]